MVEIPCTCRSIAKTCVCTSTKTKQSVCRSVLVYIHQDKRDSEESNPPALPLLVRHTGSDLAVRHRGHEGDLRSACRSTERQRASSRRESSSARTSRRARLFLFLQADRFRLADRGKVLVLHRFGRREPLRVLVPEQAVDQVDRGVRDQVLVVCGGEEYESVSDIEIVILDNCG